MTQRPTAEDMAVDLREMLSDLDGMRWEDCDIAAACRRAIYAEDRLRRIADVCENGGTFQEIHAIATGKGE